MLGSGHDDDLTVGRDVVYMHDMQPFEEISQGSGIQSCACAKVRMAARAVTRAYDDALRPVGLRATQYAVLVAAAVNDAMSITALAKIMGMDRSTLTRNLRPLEQEGLIRIGPEGHHRTRVLKITRTGRARVNSGMPLWQHAQITLKSKLGDASWIGMHNCLDNLIRVA